MLKTEVHPGMKRIEADDAVGAQHASSSRKVTQVPEIRRKGVPHAEARCVSYAHAVFSVTLLDNVERSNSKRTNTARTDDDKTDADRTSTKRTNAERIKAERANTEGKNTEGTNPEGTTVPLSLPDCSLQANAAPNIDENRTRDSVLFCKIQQLLRQLQLATARTHRFHLFVESVQDTTNDAGGRVRRTCPVFSRIAYSPTLHASDQEQKSRLAEICQKVTEFSFAKVPLTESLNNLATNGSQAQTSPQNRSGSLRQPGPLRNSEAQEQLDLKVTSVCAFWPLRVFDGLEFPSWCPFKAAEYTVPPQASNEKLFISKSVLDGFNALEDFQVMWIYQELFKFLYRIGRKRRKPGMARTLTYSQFTPPWIRRFITVQPENPIDVNGDNVAESVTLRRIACSARTSECHTNPQLWDRPDSCPMIGQVPRWNLCHVLYGATIIRDEFPTILTLTSYNINPNFRLI